jgi:hypothetical protein
MNRHPRSRTRQAVGRALLAAAAVAGPLALGAGGHVAPARADSCLHQTIPLYPGSTIFHARYGEADFHFDFCSGTAPSTWHATAVVHTNSTGSNTGITFSNPTINQTATADGEAAWSGQFTSQTCVPRIGFPCSHSGVWKVTFIGADQGSPRVWVDRTFPPDAGVTLYTTP